uniref:Reverse transcriptase domain-containing protein n=1 Tax=Ditylenchus dipsaci TaxID=166011 RepID=A0A915ET24_9BILA
MAAKKAGEGVRYEIVLEDYIDIEIEPFPFDHVEKRQPSFDDLKKYKLDSTVRNFQEKSNKIDSRTERDEFDEAEANFVNMISNAESGANVSAFKGDNSTNFARWATRFCDYVDAMGKRWSEEDKVNKLKFLLQGLPRMYFNELSDNQKDTLEKNDLLETRRLLRGRGGGSRGGGSYGGGTNSGSTNPATTASTYKPDPTSSLTPSAKYNPAVLLVP